MEVALSARDEVLDLFVVCKVGLGDSQTLKTRVQNDMRKIAMTCLGFSMFTFFLVISLERKWQALHLLPPTPLVTTRTSVSKVNELRLQKGRAMPKTSTSRTCCLDPRMLNSLALRRNCPRKRRTNEKVRQIERRLIFFITDDEGLGDYESVWFTASNHCVTHM